MSRRNTYGMPAWKRRREMRRRRNSLLGLIILAAVIIIFFVAIPAHIHHKTVFQLKGDSDLTAEAGSSYTDPGIKVSYKGEDTYHGKKLSSRIKTENTIKKSTPGTYKVIYRMHIFTARFKAVRTVTVKDTTAPAITLSGGNSLSLNQGDSYKDPGYSAKDAVDGTVTNQVKVSGSVDTGKPGTYRITYKVTDKAGNEASAVRTVIVKAKVTPVTKSTIYLTFDDGPSSEVTPRILDILKKNDVKATFFIIGYGNDPVKKKLIRREIDEGHTIGMHTISHDYAAVYKSVGTFMSEINQEKANIQKDFNYTPWMIRFPGGSSNTISAHYCKGIMSQLSRKVEEAGYSYMDWNVSSGDAEGNEIPSDRLYRNYVRELVKGKENVVLCHDTNAKKTTAAVLQKFITYGKKHGYTFKAIDQSTPMIHQRINN